MSAGYEANSSPDPVKDITCDVDTECSTCPRFIEALSQAPHAAYSIFAPPLIMPVLPTENEGQPYDDIIINPEKFTELPPDLFVRFILLGGIGVRGTGMSSDGVCCAEEKDRITSLFT